MADRSKFTISLIMEWENIKLTEKSRPKRVLTEIVKQIDQLCELSQDEQKLDYWKDFQPPVEFIITHDSEVEKQEVLDSLSGIIDSKNHNIELCLLPCPPLKYFDLKNYAAKHAHADVFVFLDCDVIPQPNWLLLILEGFKDPKIGIMGSVTYIDQSNLYAKSYALIKFDLPSEQTGIITSYDIPHGNSIAFRKEMFKKYSFPPTGTSFKLAMRYLENLLKSEGVPIYVNLSAQVEHPPPLFKNLFKRGFFHGRDELILRRENKKDREASSKLHHNQSTFFGLEEIKLLGARLTRIFTKFQKVHLSIIELPIALCIIALYYVGVAVGYFVTLILPNNIQSKFDYMTMAE